MTLLYSFPTTGGALIATVIGLFLAHQVVETLYNIFLHPLRNYPGPLSARASVFPRIKCLVTGKLVHWIVDLHAEYGEVVRISPNELAFAGAGAWKDIYGHKTAGRWTMGKDPISYPMPNGKDVGQNLINASDEVHARQRRIFSYAFSERALKSQEPLFLTHVDKLCRVLHQSVTVDPVHKFNMVDMYNFTTFDIMGDFTFGESLHMLDNAAYHPWAALIFEGIKAGAIMQSLRRFPWVLKTMPNFIKTKIIKKRKEHAGFCRDRVDRRLQRNDSRPDIWGLLLKQEEASNENLSRSDMYANSNVFMVAGTETTATLLSGLTYLLLKTPAAMDKLVQEIRTSFPRERDITVEKLPTLKYLNACIEEALRVYPPFPSILLRVVPSGGSVIDGNYVPAKTRVGVTHLAAYRNPKNFYRPTEFIPERWLGENATDKKHALQPFLVGPRMCLGKGMAYHEIRLILAKFLWHFDPELCVESENWTEQHAYGLWEKPELYCQLKPVVR